MKIHTDAEASDFLEGLINYEKLLAGGLVYNTKTFDLENFRALLADLGDPQRRYAVIHVAGTKGKGSTCAFLASVLSRAGLRTGLYTSPHIEHYRERIAVDGQEIPEARFCTILERLARLMEARQAGSDASYRTVFEILTAAAFLHFAEEQVQVAVIETGLGGRLDATNVFDWSAGGEAQVLVNVITAIGLDHQAILGDTVEQIAAEKAGIIRPHAVTVLAPQPQPWRDKVHEIVSAAVVGRGASRLLDADAMIRCEAQAPDTGFFSSDAGPEVLRDSRLAAELVHGIRLVSPLVGTHQLGNLRNVLAALVALEIASGGALSVDSESLREGVTATRWPGRFEVISREPLVIVDGAHCVLSAEALADTFLAMFGERDVVMVAGFMRDKMARDMCAVLKERLRITSAVACAPQSPRALAADQAGEILRETFGVPVAVEPDPACAVRMALDGRSGSEAVIVFGSMFLVSPARAAAR
jgi:dihydrofolate synthase / folylpolyglutamate synthase